MTAIKAQQMIQNARIHVSENRQRSKRIDNFTGDAAYREAWTILFAAENLISDPNNAHYRHITENGGWFVRETK